jgi:alpha-tubulin suppressor-like RCC1 family protein
MNVQTLSDDAHSPFTIQTRYVLDPRPISTLVGRKIAKVVVSANKTGLVHVLALTQDMRAVYSWGYNRSGQLGRGTETDYEGAGLVEALEGETIGIISLSLSLVHSLTGCC